MTLVNIIMLIMMFPETVEALSIVLEGYKNKLIQLTVDNLTLLFFPVFCILSSHYMLHSLLCCCTVLW